MKRAIWPALALSVAVAACARLDAAPPNITVPAATVHEAPFPVMTGDQVEDQIKANAQFPRLKEWWRRFVQAWAASRN
jgi:hypothetical protein